jgi:tetratricopeptide (TPR) repeat protein
MFKKLLFFLFSFTSLFLIACNSHQTALENSHLEEREGKKQPVPIFSSAAEALEAGKKYLDENKIEEAIESLKQATKLDPDLAEAYFQLGIALTLKENEEGVKINLSSSLKDQKFKEGKPVILTEADKAFEMAAKAYEKLTAKEPENAEAFFNLGRAYNKIQMDKEAKEALRQAVKLRPEDTDYQTELGAILIKLAEYDEAIKVLKKALELDENNLRAADLLEKAVAGKKRIEFAIKPKSLPSRPLEVAEEPEASGTDNSGGLSIENNPGEQAPKPPLDLQPNAQPTAKP